MAESDFKWREMDRNGKKLHKTIKNGWHEKNWLTVFVPGLNGWKLFELAGNGRKWLEITFIDGNGWQLLEKSCNNWNWLQVAWTGWNDWTLLDIVGDDTKKQALNWFTILILPEFFSGSLLCHLVTGSHFLLMHCR